MTGHFIDLGPAKPLGTRLVKNLLSGATFARPAANARGEGVFTPLGTAKLG